MARQVGAGCSVFTFTCSFAECSAQSVEAPFLELFGCFHQAIAAEELARAAGNEGMDEDETNIKYEITRKHFEEGLAGEDWS